MSEEEEPDEAAQLLDRAIRVLLIVIGGALILWGLFTWWGGRGQSEREAAQRDRAEATFEPVLEALREARGAPQAAAAPVDIDRTVRVLHEIDLALEHASSVEEYLELLGQPDYRGVAPEVLEAREEILGLLLELYAKQTELADQEAVWGFARRWMGLLTLTRAVDVEGGFGLRTPLGGAETPSIGVDTRSMLKDFEDAERTRKDLVQEVRGLQTQLVEATTRFSEVHWNALDAWDRLCLHRDRAYLAAYGLDWEAAAASAQAAIDMAPSEREAHLLKALALIEGDLAGEGDGDEVPELLQAYLDAHPASSAPALLLSGVHAARAGRADEARLLFEQASANYPRQADQLGQLLDPYHLRSRYLRKTRAGNSIRELYRSTMLGAAWFSPELQLAKLDFEAGQVEEATRRVRDHFARRRAQGQWGLIVYDIHFCEELLGDHFRQIFPEDVYLDLVIDPTFFGSRYELSVENRSDRSLHNATLILCLRFTDMHQDDYETFPCDTVPQVPAGVTTDFGEVEIAMDLFGVEKDRDDVYAERAILVSNEAVVWIDTIEFKRAPRPSVPAGVTGFLADQALGALEALDRPVELEVVSQRFFDDDVRIVLPREVALLKPVFRLRHGEETFAPEENVIEDGAIRLRFDAVAEFEGTPSEDLVLEVTGALAGVSLRWSPDPGGGYRFAGIER